MLRAGAVIDPAACALLRAALDANGTSTVDSVDQLEERVLYLGGGRDLGGGGRDLELSLEALLGRRAASALLALPEAFAQQQVGVTAGDGVGEDKASHTVTDL